MENEKNLKALLITNIPESRSEDTTKVVLTLAKHLDAELQASDIESVFRIKNDSNPKPPLIMVKLNKASARDSLYNARKNFTKKGVNTNTLGFRSTQKIFINEVLSKTQQKLFYHARKKKEQLKWRYVWTYHGQVFMRKVHDSDAVKITTEGCLGKISATTQAHDG